MTLAVQLIDTESGFLALENEWNDLQERSSNATIFSTFDWAIGCWDFCPARTKPFILKFYQDQVLVGLAPFRRRITGMRLAKLELLGMGFSHGSIADYLDILAATGYEQKVIANLLEYLTAHTEQWDMLDWPELNDATLTFQALQCHAQSSSLKYLITHSSICHSIPLPHTWEAFLAELSPSMRSTIERKTRKIVRECSAHFEQIHDPGEADRILQLLQSFHSERWSLKDKEMHTKLFVIGRQISQRMLQRGWLDLRVLRANAIPIAVIWNYRFHDTVYYYLSSFDQDDQWKKYSIGLLVLADAIKNAIGNGQHVFDLMRGNHNYKTRFASVSSQNYRYRIVHNPLLYRYYLLFDYLRSGKRGVQRKLKAGRDRVRNKWSRLTPAQSELPTNKDSASAEDY